MKWFNSVAMLLLWIPTDAAFDVALGAWNTCAKSQEGINCWVSYSLSVLSSSKYIDYLTARWHAQGWNVFGQLGLGHNDDVYEPLDSVIDLGDFEPAEIVCEAFHCCSVSTNRVSLKWYVDWWQCLVFHERPCNSLSFMTLCCVHD